MLRRAVVVTVLVAAGLAAWAFVLEPRSLRVEEASLTLPGWPTACDALRIAVLADLHAGAPHIGLEKVDALVSATIAARPALVLLAGDYVIQDVLGGTFITPEDIAAHLRPLTEAAPVYAVLGNHDWWLDGGRVSRALGGAGITMLDNTGTTVTLGACTFWLAGLGDLWEGHPDVDAALAGAEPRQAIVALTHNPDVFPKLPARITLTVAGHTHGGQVALPILGRPVVPSEFGERYAIGHIVEDGRHLFVSTGVGTSILPVRFRVPPAVTLLNVAATPGPLHDG